MSARNTQKKKTGKQRSSVNAHPLARTLAALKRSQKQEAITEAMKRAERRSGMATRLRDLRADQHASALERTVKAAKQDRKKRAIATALKQGRRGA